MKKSKIFMKSASAILCAASLLFGSVSCANSGSDDDVIPVKTPTPSSDSGNKGNPGNQGNQGAVAEVDISYKGPASVPALAITAPKTAGTITMNGTTYDTIQAAFNAATAAGDYVITLTAGTYEENNLHYTGAGNIVISGVAGKTYGTDVLIKGKGDNTSSSTEKNRCTLEFEGTSGNSLVLENLTIQNTFKRAEKTSGNTQCEALGFDSTGTCAAYNCSFLSHQDTVRTVGKAWFYGCYIEGDVDFIWMEKAGKVALYENCAIRTVTDTDNKEAYIAAPGMNAADVFNKGLVVYNSAIKLDNPTSSLFRNPWGVSEGLYNISAFVNVKVEGTLVAALQKSTASNWNADKNGAIGWKVDQELADAYTSKSSEIHTISEAVEKAEYNGRTRVINRVYKLNPEKYANDSDVWDVNALATSRKWSVTADSSKLDSVEKTSLKANGTYNIAEYATDTTQWTSIADGSSTDGYVSWSGIVYHGTSYGAAVNSGSGTVSIQVAGSSVISVMSSSYGNGTLTVTDSNGNTVLSAASTKMATDKTALSFIYKGDATTLTLTFTATSYIGTITVSAADGEQQKVTKVAVSGDDAVTKDDTITLTATVTTQYCAPSTVTWTSSDESVATVSDSGVVTGKKAGEATITATSTFDTSKKASIKVSVSESKAAKATWLDNTEASFVGKSSDTSLITVSDAVANTTKTSDPSVTGTYAYNSGKLSGEGVSLTTADSKPARDDWYIEYPITAVANVTISKVSINWGNPGTGNCFAYVTYIDENGTSVIDDTNAVARNTVNVSSTFNVNKNLAAGKTGKIRISLFGLKADGTTWQSFSGKSPTWGKTEITVLDNSSAAPVAGTTYTWNFLDSAKIAKYKANATGGTFDSFLTAVISGGWQGDTYGYNVKTNDTFTVTVIGSVNVKVSSSYSGSGYTITTTGSGTLSVADTGNVGNGDSTLNGAYGEVNYTAASATEVCTITFTSKGQNYCNGVTVTPAN